MSGDNSTNVWQTWQQLQLSVAQIVKLLGSGITVDPVPATYMVAGLPATAANGQYAFAANGRKPGEGAAAGTGVPVFFNSVTGTWFSYSSGAVVTS
jgi:hypothetical protein